VLLSILFCGCESTDSDSKKDSAANKDKLHEFQEIKPEEADGLKDKAVVYMDNILKGIDSDNYSLFSENFTDEMREGINKDAFKEMIKRFDKQKGKMLSKQYLGVLNQGLFKIYLWKAKYEGPEIKEEGGMGKLKRLPKDNLIKLVIGKVDEKYKVFGLWFQ
jgi:hypothetical protein